MIDLSIQLLLQAVASLQYKSNLKIQLAFHVTAEDSSSDSESSDDRNTRTIFKRREIGKYVSMPYCAKKF